MGWQERAGQIIESFLGVFSTVHGVIGLAVLAVVMAQVGIVLCSLYWRPVHTATGWLKAMLICFAAIVLCCMTIGLLWKLTMP